MKVISIIDMEGNKYTVLVNQVVFVSQINGTQTWIQFTGSTNPTFQIKEPPYEKIVKLLSE